MTLLKKTRHPCVLCASARNHDFKPPTQAGFPVTRKSTATVRSSLNYYILFLFYSTGYHYQHPEQCLSLLCISLDWRNHCPRPATRRSRLNMVLNGRCIRILILPVNDVLNIAGACPATLFRRAQTRCHEPVPASGLCSPLRSPVEDDIALRTTRGNQ